MKLTFTVKVKAKGSDLADIFSLSLSGVPTSERKKAIERADALARSAWGPDATAELTEIKLEWLEVSK